MAIPRAFPTQPGASRPGGWVVFFLLAALAAAGLAAIWLHGGGDNSLAEVQKRGVIRVGYSVEAPYAFLKPDGTVSGADPEIARLMAARLGIPRVEWRLVSFDNLIDGLAARQFDVIAAGMFITPGRQQRVSFSIPAFRVRAGLLVAKSNPHGLHSYADLTDRPSIRVAVLSGSVEEEAMVRIGIASERLLRVPDARSGQALIASGQADALPLSTPTLQWMLRTGDAANTEIAHPFDEGTASGEPEIQYSAFAFRKEDRALRKAWNRELKPFIGSREHLELAAPFGFTPADLPPPH